MAFSNFSSGKRAIVLGPQASSPADGCPLELGGSGLVGGEAVVELSRLVLVCGFPWYSRSNSDGLRGDVGRRGRLRSQYEGADFARSRH
jgi:hypothetical protein